MIPSRAWRGTSLRFFSNPTFWRLTDPYTKVLWPLWQYHNEVFLPSDHPLRSRLRGCELLFYLCCQMTSSWCGAACEQWSSRWWRPTPALTASLPRTPSSTVRESQSKERSVRDVWASGQLKAHFWWCGGNIVWTDGKCSESASF